MCLICDRIEMIKRGENPYFVRELKTGYVVIGDHQHFRGYTLFLYKEHGDKTELFHLDKAERALFMEEMTLVAQAAAKAFGAEKMNYELLGMGDAHLHWHLTPRAAATSAATAITERVLYGGIPWKRCTATKPDRILMSCKI